MKKTICLSIKLCTFFLLFISCTNDANNSAVENLKANQIHVKSLEDVVKNSGIVNNQLTKFTIAKKLNNFTNHKLSYDEILEKHFINVTGEDASGQLVAFRQEVKVDNKNNIITFPKDGRGESCAGVNCTNCIIKSGGGCKCSAAGIPSEPSYCNHTVTNPK